MTEREFQVNRLAILSEALVIINDDELGNLSGNELNELILSSAIKEDNWKSLEELGDDVISYEVYENWHNVNAVDK